MAGYFRPAVMEDCSILAPVIRPIDVKECEIVAGLPPYDALVLGLRTGPAFTLITHDGLIIGMFGVSPMQPGWGAIWLLCSDELSKPTNAIPLMIEGRKVIDTFQQHYPVLYNHIHRENRTTLRWLLWSGFEITGESQFQDHVYIERRGVCAHPPHPLPQQV